MSKKKHDKKPSNEVSLNEYLSAQAELDALREEHGLQPEEGKISRFISSLFERGEAREKVCVNRKKLIWLAVLTGWCGGHRFYSKRYILGAFYLVFCWTGVPLTMTIIDLMEIIPIPPDENGNIMI